MRLALFACVLLIAAPAVAQPPDAGATPTPQAETGGETQSEAEAVSEAEAEAESESEAEAEAESEPEAEAEAESEAESEPESEPEAEPEAETGSQVGLGLMAGASMQTDAVYAGPRIEIRELFASYFGADLALLAGTAVDYVIARASLHARLVLPLGDVRVALVAGAGLIHARPIGELGEFCQRLEDGCNLTELGAEIGLGFAWRGLGFDFLLGTGEIPLASILLHATLFF